MAGKGQVGTKVHGLSCLAAVMAHASPPLMGRGGGGNSACCSHRGTVFARTAQEAQGPGKVVGLV